jgi:hypothetical protein
VYNVRSSLWTGPSSPLLLGMYFRHVSSVSAMLILLLSEQSEYQVYQRLLAMVPGLEERLMTSISDEQLLHIADLVRIVLFLGRSD